MDLTVSFGLSTPADHSSNDTLGSPLFNMDLLAMRRSSTVRIMFSRDAPEVAHLGIYAGSRQVHHRCAYQEFGFIQWSGDLYPHSRCAACFRGESGARLQLRCFRHCADLTDRLDTEWPRARSERLPDHF